MKLNYKVLSLVALLGFASFSCEDYLGGDINEDPNKPSFVPLQGTLANVQIVVADVYGGYFSRLSAVFTQQTQGVARQWVAIDQYDITFDEFDTPWSEIYENALVELQFMKADAEEQGFNHYLGVLLVTEAFTLLTATDAWGDIPYSEAFQGLDILSPTYDAQASIYTVVYGNLDRALTLFAGSAGALTPGNEDVYYGGDISLWTKAAYGIRARAKLHEGDYAGALADAGLSLESPAENMQYQYSSANAAPWFRFNRDRTGDLQFHPTMRGIMTGLNDTLRLNQFDTNYEQHAAQPYLVDAYAVELLSFRELKFMEAECLVRTGGAAADIEAAYLAGISASFEEAGLTAADAAAYSGQADVNPGAADIDLEDVMIQKYIGLFVQPESWTDWRRTDIPSLTPTAGSQIPRRWTYPLSEFNANENAPNETDITMFAPRVGWDN